MTDQPRQSIPRWRRILLLARPQWRGYSLIWALTMASSIVVLLQPWPIQFLVDHVLGEKPAPAWLEALLSHLPGTGSPLALAAWVAMGSLLIFIIQAMVDVALTMSWLRVAQRSVYRLAGDVFARLQRRSPSFHAVTPVGDSLTRITGDSWCIYNAVGALVFTPMHALLVGGLMTYILLSMNPTLTLIAFAAAPVLAGTSLVLGRHAERAKGLERQIQGQIESHLQQSLAGIRVVQTSVQEDREQNRFLQLAGTAVFAHRRSALIAALSGGSAGLVTAIGTGAVLGLGAFEVIAGRLTLGQLFVFLAYLGVLNGQLVRLATAYTTLRGLAPSIDRIAAVLDTPTEVVDAPDAQPLPATGTTSRGLAVRLENITYEYTPGRPVLRDITLDVPAGATLAIVGSSGSGKSTLATLLPRLMDPSRGRILINDCDIRTVRLDSLRANIAIAFQDPMLFADSIATNIALGRPDATMAEIKAAGSIAGLDRVVDRLPHGYNTVLGQAGSTVSGGEQQRIAIARALLSDAPLLILDEPSSALDSMTEARLFEALESGPPRTTIIIAHRLSTVRHADIIAVLDDGRLVETGQHEELLRLDGIYARLWRLQAGTDEAVPGPVVRAVATKEPMA